MFIRRLNIIAVKLVTLCGALGALLLAGCSVDSSQIKFANMYEWTQTEEYGESGPVSHANSRKAASIAHITDSFPAPIDQARGSFFPLTAARLTLGSFGESRRTDTDYI